MATSYLLAWKSWTGMSKFKADLIAARTRQHCDAMTGSKELMQNLLLMARRGVGTLIVNLPTGTERRKKLAGEGNVMLCFYTTEVLPNGNTSPKIYYRQDIAFFAIFIAKLQ